MRHAQRWTPGGVLAVWSAAPDAAFAKRLARCGFAVTPHRVRASPLPARCAPYDLDRRAPALDKAMISVRSFQPQRITCMRLTIIKHVQAAIRARQVALTGSVKKDGGITAVKRAGCGAGIPRKAGRGLKPRTSGGRFQLQPQQDPAEQGRNRASARRRTASSAPNAPPIRLITMISGTSLRKGMRRSEAQIPAKGRFSTTRITLPMIRLAIRAREQMPRFCGDESGGPGMNRMQQSAHPPAPP